MARVFGRRALPILLSAAALLGTTSTAVASDAGIRDVVKKNEKPLNDAQAKLAVSLAKLTKPKAGTPGLKAATRDIHALRKRIATYSRALTAQDADGPSTSVPQDSLLAGLRDLRIGYTSVETALKRLTVPAKKLPKTKSGAAKLYKAIEADVKKGFQRVISGASKVQVATDALLGRKAPTPPAPEPAPPTPEPAPPAPIA